MAVYSESEPAHSELEKLIDTVARRDLADRALVAAALAGRASALIITMASAFSAFSAGAALIALFNIALRGTRRQIIAITALGVAGGSSTRCCIRPTTASRSASSS